MTCALLPARGAGLRVQASIRHLLEATNVGPGSEAAQGLMAPQGAGGTAQHPSQSGHP